MRRLVILLVALAASGSAAADPADTALASVGALPGAASTMMRDPGCRDAWRRSVRLLEVRALGDAGRAEFVGSGPVIKFDPDIMQGLPSSLQSFFLLHECAHHVLGHLFAPTRESEKEADCWAMREGARRGAFHAGDVATWRPAFEKSRGSPMHLPGPQRLEFLIACTEP